MRFWRLVFRALRLRCPRCGKSPLFRGPWSMLEKCDQCELPYQREPGFFLGAIYVSYGLTALIATAGYMVMAFVIGISPKTSLWVTLAFVVLFPLWFFRYARALWLGFDQFVDPLDPMG